VDALPLPIQNPRTLTKKRGESMAVRRTRRRQETVSTKPEQQTILVSDRENKQGGQTREKNKASDKFNINNTPDNFTGGKTKRNVHAWQEITRDQWVLNQIRGVYPELNFMPVQTNIPRGIRFSTQEHILIEKEVKELLRKEVIKPVNDSERDQNQVYSNIFAREKNNGTLRIILNLKQFNNCVRYTHFKMSSLRDAVCLMQKQCFFCSVDIKDAYYSVALHEKARKFFRFMFGEKKFEFTSLVMGYSDAPRIFTKIMKPVLAHLRDENITIIMYIDDALIVGKTYSDCLQACHKVCTLFDKLGLTINTDKSCLTPTQKIKYLGFVLDSVSMNIMPTEEKVKKIQGLCGKYIEKELISIRELAEITGTLVAVCPGNEYGEVFYKRLEIYKNKALAMQKGNFDRVVTMTDTIKEDLAWWRSNTGGYPAKIRPYHDGLLLTSDASMTGWGGEHKGVKTGGLWSEEESNHHINCLELKAALLTLKAFTTDKIHCDKVTLLCDNTTAVSCINRKGSMREDCNNITRDIWLWCLKNNMRITAVHIPGKDNTEADEASREKGLETEWSLEDSVFIAINKRYGAFQVDLFASRINHKVQKYVSWKKDAGAWRINAFSFSWTNMFAYIFPPFNLILRVLQKIEAEEADCVMIDPVWKAQPWFPKLTNLLTEVPTLLPKSPNLLHHPVSKTKTHPILRNSRMIACRLSGKYSQIQTFQRKLSQSSSNPGDQAQENSTQFTSRNGLYFVINSIKIPFLPLHQHY